MSFLFVEKDRCPFCHRPANGRFGLCRDCLDMLEAPGACHRFSSTDDVPFYAYSALFYNRFLRHYFGAYKFHQRTAYEFVFQHLLSAYAKQHPLLSRASWVSYIPQHHRREVLRTSNPAKALAESVASALAIPLLPLLQKDSSRKAQKTMAASERLRNVRGAFSLSPSALRTSPFGVGIVCDDFITTGNTLWEALQILEEAQWYAVGLTLACVNFPTEEENEGGWLQQKEER